MNGKPGNEKNGLEVNNEFSCAPKSNPGMSWLSKDNNGYQGSQFVGSGISGCFLSPTLCRLSGQATIRCGKPHSGMWRWCKAAQDSSWAESSTTFGVWQRHLGLGSHPSPAFKSALIHVRIIRWCKWPFGKRGPQSHSPNPQEGNWGRVTPNLQLTESQLLPGARAALPMVWVLPLQAPFLWYTQDATQGLLGSGKTHWCVVCLMGI